MAQFTGEINDIKSQWFASKGFASNTLNDQMSKYLAQNGGGISNYLHAQWYNFLASKGRTGSFLDMYKAELIASLTNASSKDSITDL
jgi:hypothetical protein